MPVTSADTLRDLLGLRTVAVVGCSSTPGKAAHDVPAYLQRHGYDVVPVNPYADDVLGEETYDSLAAVEDAIDLVDVFRPSEDVPAVVDQVVSRHRRRGDVEAVWLQAGIHHDEAAARAEDAGLDVVQSRCLKVAHRRLGDGE
jgi:hypothetical protein